MEYRNNKLAPILGKKIIWKAPNVMRYDEIRKYAGPCGKVKLTTERNAVIWERLYSGMV